MIRRENGHGILLSDINFRHQYEKRKKMESVHSRKQNKWENVLWYN